VRIAVVQHQLRETPVDDAEALYQAAVTAAAAGAEFVIVPEVFSLHGDDNQNRAMLFLQLGSVAGQRLIPQVGPGTRAYAGIASAPQGVEALGKLALLVGDACMDAQEFERLAAERPDVAVMLPRSESELQAEAVLEVALALSDSLAGLVLVADNVGAELGEPGHGGSAIIRLGEIVAEAVNGDDVLLADIDTPVAQPGPREALPQVPPILAQRLAKHSGTRPKVDYLADLTDGTGPA